MKSNECFFCLNCGDGIGAENTGWYHSCRLGLPNEGLNNISSCPQYKRNDGFQIGGYYIPMHFEPDGECLDWIIHGNGDFPSHDPAEWLHFHICDFTQIERWVKIWGDELRRRGLIDDE